MKDSNAVKRYIELEELAGVGRETTRRLRENGIQCVEILSIMTVSELHLRTRLEEGTCVRVLREARQRLELDIVKTGTEREQEILQRRRLTTGLPRIDKHLMGGLETGSVVEFYGAARAGKTQWCHQLAVTSLLPESRNGLGGNVIWLDTESSFRPLTIRANALRMGIDPDRVLDRIQVFHVLNRDQLIEQVRELPRLVVENDCSLVIIDNIGRFFRFELEGLSLLRPLSNDLLRLFETLWGVAATMDCIVVYTNQVYNHIGMYGNNPNAPVGGHVVAHAPAYRFYVRVGHREKRVVELRDHAGLPEFSEELRLGWGGLFQDDREKRAMGPVISEYLDSLAYYNPSEATVEEGV